MKDFQATMSQLNGTMGQVLAALKNPVAPPPTTRQAPEPDDEIDPNTLETLPRTEFMKIMERRMAKAFEKSLLGPVKEELTTLRNGLTTSNTQKQLDNALAKYPDLLEYKDEMIALAKAHPSLGPTQLYQLAKTDASPEKIAEVAKKFPPANDGAKKPQVITFGGFKPTNGASGDDRSAKMAPAEAADEAWSSVVAELGAEPSFSE
jgi:hypothetical protein